MSGKRQYTVKIENLVCEVAVLDGFFNYANTDFQSVHMHKSYEIHAMLSGEATINTEFERIHLAEGEAYIIAPGVAHTAITGKPQSVSTCFSVSFKPVLKKTDGYLYEVCNNGFSKIETYKKIPFGSTQADHIKAILAEFKTNDLFSDERIKNHFSLILLEIFRNLTENAKNAEYEKEADRHDDDMRVLIIEQYLNTNYNQSPSVAELAEILYLCEKQVYRIMQSKLNTTFTQYVTKLRLKSAVSLLVNTDFPVGDIAQKVGYSSYNGLYNLFVSRLHMSPEEYRNKAAENTK